MRRLVNVIVARLGDGRSAPSATRLPPPGGDVFAEGGGIEPRTGATRSVRLTSRRQSRHDCSAFLGPLPLPFTWNGADRPVARPCGPGRPTWRQARRPSYFRAGAGRQGRVRGRRCTCNLGTRTARRKRRRTRRMRMCQSCSVLPAKSLDGEVAAVTTAPHPCRHGASACGTSPLRVRVAGPAPAFAARAIVSGCGCPSRRPRSARPPCPRRASSGAPGRRSGRPSRRGPSR